jgi:hypothetical protein
VLIGVLGLVPGVTSRYAELDVAGKGSHAQLFGVFQVSVLLDLVHLAFGVVGIVLARATGTALRYLRGGGAFLLALWVVGVVDLGGFVALDAADNWLHFAAGVGMIGLGVVGGRATARAAIA